MNTSPAYMIVAGQSVTFPGMARPKKVYRVEDAGTRYQVNDLGQTESVCQIRFHINAPPQSGQPGTFLHDWDDDLEIASR